MSYCFLFPGQGAQYPGMGKDLYEESAAVRNLFSRASEQSGFDCAALIFEGSEQDLKATDKTQIAITLVNLSASIVLKERGINPEAVAGFSLGEYAALVEAGVLGVDDVFPVVRARGEFMEQASRLYDSDQGNSGMAAVIGLEYEAVRDAVGFSGIEDLYPAIWNSPAQIVLAGTGRALSEAGEVMKAAGARRVIPLKVSGPFHTPLMEPAREKFAGVLNRVQFEDPIIPVYTNVTGKRLSSGDEARQMCLTQLVSTVLWVAEQGSILNDRYNEILEVGPGTVLAGLWKNFIQSGAGSSGETRTERDSVTAPGSLSIRAAGTLEDIVAITKNSIGSA